jgi:hypothetical protein
VAQSQEASFSNINDNDLQTTGDDVFTFLLAALAVSPAAAFSDFQFLSFFVGRGFFFFFSLCAIVSGGVGKEAFIINFAHAISTFFFP